MRKLVLAATVLLLVGPALAGPLQLAQVPATAKAVMHLDIEAALKSEIGQYAVKQATKEGSPLAAKLTECKDTFGFDPLKDVQSVTVFSDKFDDTSMVALVRATNVDQAKALAKLSTNEGYKEDASGPVKIYTWINKKDHKTMFGCFYAKDVVVISGSRESLDSALAVLDKKKDALKADTLKCLPTAPAGAFLTAGGEGFPIPEKANPPILKKVKFANMVAGEADKKVFLKLTAGLEAPKDAEDCRKVVEGFVAMFGMMLVDNPPPAGDPNTPPPAPTPEEQAATKAKAAVADLLQSLKVTSAENTLTIEISLPVEKVTALIAMGKDLKGTLGRGGHSAPPPAPAPGGPTPAPF